MSGISNVDRLASPLVATLSHARSPMSKAGAKITRPEANKISRAVDHAMRTAWNEFSKGSLPEAVLNQELPGRISVELGQLKAQDFVYKRDFEKLAALAEELYLTSMGEVGGI